MLGPVQEVVVDCADPGRLARFWAGVVGGEAVRRSDDWWYVDPPGWTRLAFQRVPEPKAGKNRLHLDIEVPGPEALGAATERAEALGATRVGGVVIDDQGPFQVLADPEGNEWCLVA